MMVFVVIPGRSDAANPEPSHTDDPPVFSGVCAYLAEPVFMGSGSRPAGCPGMTIG
jgi:hypothetical protein